MQSCSSARCSAERVFHGFGFVEFAYTHAFKAARIADHGPRRPTPARW